MTGQESRCWAHYRQADDSVGHCEGPVGHWGDHGHWGPLSEDQKEHVRKALVGDDPEVMEAWRKLLGLT